MAVRGSPTRQLPRDTACPSCGAPAERGQLVCLECGSRVALAYRRPPSWKLPVAIVVVLGVLALLGAVLAYNAIDDEARKEVSATPPAPRQPTSTARDESRRAREARERRRATQRRSAENRPAPAAAGTGGLVKRGKLYSWPASLGAFTVVLQTGEDRASALRFANEVADRNDAKTGVIRSDDFQSLPQGMFIVFGGVYETRERAEQAVRRLRARYSRAFAQRVKR
jgi:hypothetical protein